MTTPEAPKFGVKFPSRKDRVVKRVTKCETRDIQKRISLFVHSAFYLFSLQGLEPPKPPPIRPPPKPKATKKPKPATLIKPTRPPRDTSTRSTTPKTTRPTIAKTTARTLQTS